MPERSDTEGETDEPYRPEREVEKSDTEGEPDQQPNEDGDNKD